MCGAQIIHERLLWQLPHKSHDGNSTPAMTIGKVVGRVWIMSDSLSAAFVKMAEMGMSHS